MKIRVTANSAVPPHGERFLGRYCIWWELATMETPVPHFRSTYPELQYAKRRGHRLKLANAR